MDPVVENYARDTVQIELLTNLFYCAIHVYYSNCMIRAAHFFERLGNQQYAR
jgi:hypothetical protein